MRRHSVLIPYLSLLSILLMGLVPSVALMAETRPLAEDLRQQLEKKSVHGAGQGLDWSRLQTFYSKRGYEPAWLTTKAGVRIRAMQWRTILQDAEAEGLEPEHYHLQAIEKRLPRKARPERIGLELLLTDAFFRYHADVRAGQKDDPNWRIATPKEDGVTRLEKTLASKDFAAALKRLPPPHQGYRDLRQALAHYRRVAKQGGWRPLPEKKLYWGMWHDNVSLMRERLTMGGDLPAGKVEEARFFDQNLKQAVERFQHRHGLKADGIVGATTRARMNLPVSHYIEQIKLNMKRWRWLPRSLGKRYLLVNTAGYELFLFEQGRPRLAMRVITGRPEHPTPIFRNVLSNVIINPYWYVPKRIVLEDLIPKQLRNPRFFSANRIRILTSLKPDAKELDPASIDWSSLTPEHFPYVFRQDPGPYNSLGRIKFHLKNNYNIYLHDTPQRYLFDISTRAFSSGCVRVEEPRQLAHYLLSEDQNWSRDKLEQAIRSGDTLNVSLNKPVPIYLVYWTAWVGPDQAVYFRNDIYERDAPKEKSGAI